MRTRSRTHPKSARGTHFVSTTIYDASWTLEQARALIDELVEPLKVAGYGLALAGSVLHKGESKHDLDLIVFPLSSETTDLSPARKAFHACGLRLFVGREHVVETWRKQGSRDDKHVEIWERANRRVDIFFLR